MRGTLSEVDDRRDDLMKQSAIASQINEQTCISCLSLSSDNMMIGESAKTKPLSAYNREDRVNTSVKKNLTRVISGNDNSESQNIYYERGTGYESDAKQSVFVNLIAAYFWPIAILIWIFKNKTMKNISMIIIGLYVFMIIVEALLRP